MDALISAAARALAAGDTLAALQRVSLRDDPPALALRGIAMAQLGEYARARDLLRDAERGFARDEADWARARCIVAGAEVALALRDFDGAQHGVLAAVSVLRRRGDAANVAQAHLVLARRALLLGRLDEARTSLQQVDPRGLPPLVEAVAALAASEWALRALRLADAQGALGRAHDAAARSGVAALQAEVADAASVLVQPAARRLVPGGAAVDLRLHEVAALLETRALVIDGCRHMLRADGAWLPLARRPVLFTLARALAEAWPGDARREALIERAFRTRRPDETHRARLRVEIGRLRAEVARFATIEATRHGFALRPRDGREVAVLVPPVEGESGAIVALLADGAAWSTSGLALALGASQRTVQRALAELEAAGRVRAIGAARARRWLAPPLTGFTTILLLPASLPPG